MVEKLKEENRLLCKEMAADSKKKKEISEVKSNLATTQGQIKNIKEKIEQENEKQKQVDEDIKVMRKQIIEKTRLIQNSGQSKGSEQESSVTS